MIYFEHKGELSPLAVQVEVPKMLFVVVFHPQTLNDLYQTEVSLVF